MSEVTIRERLEAIRDRHAEGDFFDSWHQHRDCARCPGVYFPCPDHEDAAAALEILKNAEQDCFDADVGMVRLVPDPVAAATSSRHGSGQVCRCGHTLGCKCNGCTMCGLPGD